MKKGISFYQDGVCFQRWDRPAPFIVHFRRSVNYDGGFGFDWLRDEYIIYTNENMAPLCDGSNIEKLKKEYNAMKCTMPPRAKQSTYYIPYLSMFRNHEQKTGNRVELILDLEFLYEKWKQETIEFVCSAGIRVEPPVMEIKKSQIEELKRRKKNDRYNEVEGGPKIEIFCNRELEQEGTIEVKSLEYDCCIGKLILVKNKEIPLKIRLVPFLRKDFLTDDRAFINERIQGIISHLKNKSLQQAMIVPSIEVTNELVFDDAQWEVDGKIKEKQIERNVFVKLIQSRLDAYNEYNIQTDNSGLSFKGVIVFLCNMNYQVGGVGGDASYNPTQDNYCIMFREGLGETERKTDYSNVAHEIAHVLGLNHTFENHLDKRNTTDNRTPRQKYNDRKKKLPEIQQDLEKNTLEKEEYWINEAKKSKKKEDIEKYRNYATIVKENRENAERDIKKYQRYFESFEWLDANQYIEFKEGQTDNIMDYYISGIGGSKYKPNSFFRWQWDIMQKEIKKYHSGTDESEEFDEVVVAL